MDYTPDSRGTRAWLRHSEQLTEIVESAAEIGAAFLREIAPVDTGQYGDSVVVETGVDLFKGDRVAAFVVAGAPHSSALEFDQDRRRVPPPRPLTRVLGMLDAGGAV